MDDVSAIVEENTAATEQMAASAIEVTESIEGVSASAEEMSAQVEEINASTDSLADMALNLQKTVSTFYLEKPEDLAQKMQNHSSMLSPQDISADNHMVDETAEQDRQDDSIQEMPVADISPEIEQQPLIESEVFTYNDPVTETVNNYDITGLNTHEDDTDNDVLEEDSVEGKSLDDDDDDPLVTGEN
ncbi:hypothetical protein EH221_01620 [bacterium]|nr:MAG: hypothetical protein EH221_01620 [bacterium]